MSTAITQDNALVPADPLAEAIAGQFSQLTRDCYRGDVALFLLHLTSGIPADWKVLPPAERQHVLREVFNNTALRARLLTATRADVRAYRRQLVEVVGAAPRTVNRRLSGLSSVLRELMFAGYIQANPVYGVRGLRVQETYSATPALSPKRAKQLMIAADSDASIRGRRDASIVRLMLTTGIRAQEVCDIRAGDIAEKAGRPVLRVMGKGRQERDLVITPSTLVALAAWRACLPEAWADDYLYVRLDRTGPNAPWEPVDKRFTTRGLRKVMSRLAKVAWGKGSKLHPHQLRHTAASLALGAGVSMVQIQYMLGHSSVTVTERYARVAQNLTENPADVLEELLHT